MEENTLKDTALNDGQHCGFVAIIGAPNAGKSTLLNQLCGQKLSIVSQKIQTTRFNVRGVIIEDNAQIILVDTPGIFAPKERLDRAMVASAWQGSNDADLLIHMIDAPSYNRMIKGEPIKGDKRNAEDIDRIQEGLKAIKKPCIAALNKIDEIEIEDLPLLAKNLFDTGYYAEILMISALRNKGLDALIKLMKTAVPIGPWLYPEDQVSDIPMRLMASEITREKVFLRLHDELPYLANVETDNWKVQKDKSIRIDQTLYVGREGHKAIAIGKGGEALKWISTNARLEMQETFESKIHLFVHVKVKENWAADPNHYVARGLDYNA